jgi:hypothetical protein
VRIRTIKPEFWSSLTVSELPVAARLTFIGLWNYADDEGRGVFDPRLIRAAIWPLEDNVTVAKVQGHLDALTAARLITVYSDGDRSYFSVTGWEEHQSISKPRPSRFPAPSVTLPGILPEPSSRERKGTGKGKEQGTGKGTGLVPAPRERARDLVFEAFCEVTNLDWHDLSADRRDAVNGMLASIRRGNGDDPDEIRRRAGNWAWDVAITPEGLTKRWAELSTARTNGKLSPAQATAARAAALEAQGR